MAFLGDLARKRSLASAAFLFLLLVDEIEGLAYMAVAVVLGQPDLFLSMQQVFRSEEHDGDRHVGKALDLIDQQQEEERR